MAKNRKLITRMERVFKAKDKLHKSLARLSFEAKVGLLPQLQEIARNMKPRTA
jgi:hypothetical protein